MFLRDTNTSRSGWKFTYKGSELRESARRNFLSYRKKEKAARVEAAKMVADINVSAESDEARKLKTEISRLGRLREECGIFHHEFKRNPAKEYHLSIGDVDFFDLAPLAVNADVPEKEI